MTVALLANDRVTGEILATLLARANIEAVVLRPPRPGRQRDQQVAALRTRFTDVLSVDGRERDVRTVAVRPSLDAWLTRDPEANQAVLGTRDVPTAEDAADWLRARDLMQSGRRYSATIEGKALVAKLDLGTLAAFSPDFRELVAELSPGWVSGAVRRGRGRPPGVALFRGSGYALCLELLHRGAGSQVTPADLIEALHRTKTPVLRLINECQRRGFLHRSTPRGPLLVRNTARLVDDMVTSVKAERARHAAITTGLNTDRDPSRLAERVARSLAKLGRTLVVTGAEAVLDHGGELLAGAPTYAYASTAGIPTHAVHADAYADQRHPRLVLIEPTDEAFFHRLVPGSPATVSPWQAAIDLLASDSVREREVGSHVRRRLEGRP